MALSYLVFELAIVALLAAGWALWALRSDPPRRHASRPAYVQLPTRRRRPNGED